LRLINRADGNVVSLLLFLLVRCFCPRRQLSWAYARGADLFLPTR
jgi:hypothetical protein